MRFGSLACWFGLLLVLGCDAAKEDFERCVALEASDLEAALSACEMAVEKSADSDSGKAATIKAAKLEATINALNKKRAEEAMKAQIARWKALPRELDKKIRKQAMWDLGRGTVTTVIKIITAEAGEPMGAYESSYGAIDNYVWGVDLDGKVSEERIHQAPFAVIMLRGLACGDYGGGGDIEFWSEGERLRTSQ